MSFPDLGYNGFERWLDLSRGTRTPKNSIIELQNYTIEEGYRIPFAGRAVDWFEIAVKDGKVEKDETPAAYVKACVKAIKRKRELDHNDIQNISDCMKIYPKSFVEAFKDLIPEDIKEQYLVRATVGAIEQNKVDGFKGAEQFVERNIQGFGIEGDPEKVVEKTMISCLNEDPGLHDKLEQINALNNVVNKIKGTA